MTHIGVFELFRIGIGPSSSHTVGPMRAATRFVEELGSAPVASIDVHLYGSLAATGDGHGTPGAVLAGLMGLRPEHVDIPAMRESLAEIENTGMLPLASGATVPLTTRAIVRHPLTVLGSHPNALTFRAGAADGSVLLEQTWYSVGGGFIARDGEPPVPEAGPPVPLPFASADELLESCDRTGLPIWAVARANELSQRSEPEFESGVAAIYAAMRDCIQTGLTTGGMLPGRLQVERRAKAWHDALLAEPDPRAPHLATEWLNVVALAVNEENAAGGRVVTAPTNGAAGIIPSVLAYALAYVPSELPEAERVERFLLTSAAIGSLYKTRASISGAEVGCQGEVGSASSMAAAGMAELLGGNPRQVENAAEIAMEHNLGLSCDPVGGLVQIPCIERNAIAAAKAVNAATMALRGTGSHRVSLDQVIETMRQTGLDMSDKYKETSRGGLAVNVIEC